MGLTAKQMKLPDGLKKAILAKQKTMSAKPAKPKPAPKPKMTPLKSPANTGRVGIVIKSAPKPKMTPLKSPANTGRVGIVY